MIGMDTNVVVRLAVVDDEDQWRRADAFMRARTPDDPAFVSLLALAETVWVLTRSYRKTPAEIRGFVRSLLGSPVFLLEREQLVVRALHDSEEHGTDFADALIAHLGVEAGADGTVTLGANAAELPSMLAL